MKIFNDRTISIAAGLLLLVAAPVGSTFFDKANAEEVATASARQSAAQSIDVTTLQSLLQRHAQVPHVEGEQCDDLQHKQSYMARVALKQLNRILQQAEGVWEIRQEDHPQLFHTYLLLSESW